MEAPKFLHIFDAQIKYMTWITQNGGHCTSQELAQAMGITLGSARKWLGDHTRRGIVQSRAVKGLKTKEWFIPGWEKKDERNLDNAS